jgi:hypothetical protein
MFIKKYNNYIFCANNYTSNINISIGVLQRQQNHNFIDVTQSIYRRGLSFITYNQIYSKIWKA